jgi:glycosyltransferase involved in cell wall biosynthesis
VRIALVYDCLHPPSVGGAERWLHALATDLARDHEVTYLTRRQWEPGADPVPGVRCVAVAGGGPIERADGRRRLGPPLAFGAGVLAHLLRHRGDYDLVHCLSYPLTTVPAARLAAAGGGPALVVEWLECLSGEWWHDYAGRAGGAAGRLAQAICLRATPSAVCFSAHTEQRLRAAGLDAPIERLGGLWEAEPIPDPAPGGAPYLLFAGRHVPDKGVSAIIPLLARARGAEPRLRAVIAGDGPLRPGVEEDARRHGLEDAIDLPGFVERAELLRLLAGARCLVAPSRRDGHGMVVAEAAAAGTPVVVARAPDSALTELVAEGVNGAVADSPDPDDLAPAVARVLEGGNALRESTARWWDEHREALSAEAAIAALRRVHAEALSG